MNLQVWPGAQSELSSHGVPAIALGAMVLFYLLAVRAYRALGEVLRSAIDIFRFELIKKLHLKKPVDSDDEKATWEKLSRHMMLMGTDQIVFKHNSDEL